MQIPSNSARLQSPITLQPHLNMSPTVLYRLDLDFIFGLAYYAIVEGCYCARTQILAILNEDLLPARDCGHLIGLLCILSSDSRCKVPCTNRIPLFGCTRNNKPSQTCGKGYILAIYYSNKRPLFRISVYFCL